MGASGLVNRYSRSAGQRVSRVSSSRAEQRRPAADLALDSASSWTHTPPPQTLGTSSAPSPAPPLTRPHSAPTRRHLPAPLCLSSATPAPTPPFPVWALSSPRAGSGVGSLVFGLRAPIQRATLQQGTCTGGPTEGGCEGGDDGQVPGHRQDQCGHCACQAQGGLSRGQPGPAGPHVSQHRLQLEVGAQHRADVEELVAVTCGREGRSRHTPGSQDCDTCDPPTARGPSRGPATPPALKSGIRKADLQN